LKNVLNENCMIWRRTKNSIFEKIDFWRSWRSLSFFKIIWFYLQNV